ASTMASMIEALGVGMPGNAALPAVDARRYVLARMAGRRIVELVKEKVSLSRILTRDAFENAIRALAAIGGSTNAVIHLTALARRIGVDLDLDDFDRLGRGVHTLVNLMPSGKYLMEDFYYAGGLPAVLRELGENNLLHRDALTVNGKTLWENNHDAPCWNRDVIHSWKSPFKKDAGIAVLRGGGERLGRSGGRRPAGAGHEQREDRGGRREENQGGRDGGSRSAQAEDVLEAVRGATRARVGEAVLHPCSMRERKRGARGP